MCLEFSYSQNTQYNTHCIDYLKAPWFLLFKENDVIMQFLHS